jgi:diketogulonate reductase-like aldo/keto reductase
VYCYSKEEVRNKIEETLNKLGLEYPNYGLYMYPRAKHYQVGIWKILEIIEKIILQGRIL